MDTLLAAIWAFREHQFSETRQQLDSANDGRDSLRQQVADAQARLAHANLAILALWELQEKSLGLTVAQVQIKMAEIQARPADSNTTGPCAGCGRSIPLQRSRCLYCGQMRTPVDAQGLTG